MSPAPLAFDVFTVLDRHADLGETPQMVIWRTVDQACRADELGFDTFWVAEHHFSDYGICPAPPVLLSAIAQRTRRIRIGPAVCVLPFEQPVRVAEQYALVDILSHGRLQMGVGSGYLPHEFSGFGLDATERRERFAQHLDVLLDLWSGRPRSIGGAGSEQIRVNVQPLQAPRPPIWVAVGHPQSVRPAARAGLPILLIPYAAGLGDDAMAALVNAYQAGLPSGVSGAVGAAYHTVVAPTDAKADVLLREALDRYVRTHGHQGAPSAEELVAGGFAIQGRRRDAPSGSSSCEARDSTACSSS